MKCQSATSQNHRLHGWMPADGIPDGTGGEIKKQRRHAKKTTRTTAPSTFTNGASPLRRRSKPIDAMKGNEQCIGLTALLTPPIPENIQRQKVQDRTGERLI
jgi:hypothetical protein